MKENESKLVGRYVAYLIAPEFVSAEELRRLTNDLAEEIGVDEYLLPDPVA
jgi:hypothetical protein